MYGGSGCVGLCPPHYGGKHGAYGRKAYLSTFTALPFFFTM